jgi:hypothetical protein
MIKLTRIGVILHIPIYNKFKVYNDNRYDVFSHIGKNRRDRKMICVKWKKHLKCRLYYIFVTYDTKCPEYNKLRGGFLNIWLALLKDCSI